MTIPTPTSDAVTALAPETPPGLPDAATLGRWANEFFAALPTSASAGSASGVPAGLPSVPRSALDVPAQADPVSALASAIVRLSAADLVHPALPVLPTTDPGLSRAPVAPGSLPTGGVPSFYFLENSATTAGARHAARHPPFDVNTIRRDFPILQERVHGRPLVWFDNAATTQKPFAVIDRLSHFYRHENSNIHRAAHELAARATDAYEGARRQVQQFLGAASANEIVFVRGATEAINLVAQSWGRKNIGEGDEILISHLEHHANIVPWQMLAAERGAKLKVVPVDSRGQLRLDELQRLLNSRTKLVSITHVSNALGTVTPIREIIDLGHRAGACVLIDGAQSVSHIPVNVQSLDADFFVLSGHKIFGPTGIGVLYGKTKRLEDMPPWQGGGNMIDDVTFERTSYQPPPARFEAGTGNIADAVGLGAALEYLTTIGMPNIEHYETELLGYATERLAAVPGLEIVGTAAHKASVLSFVIDGLEPTAIGTALNQEGIAVRAGHHCAQPILRRFGHEATVRASLAFYNTCAEVDTMIAVLQRLSASSTGRRAATRST
jgi:cysteine desulfurase/selenocysteine lyase